MNFLLLTLALPRRPARWGRGRVRKQRAASLSLAVIITHAQFGRQARFLPDPPARVESPTPAGLPRSCSRAHGSLTRTVVGILREPITPRSQPAQPEHNPSRRTALASCRQLRKCDRRRLSLSLSLRDELSVIPVIANRGREACKLESCRISLKGTALHSQECSFSVSVSFDCSSYESTA